MRKSEIGLLEMNSKLAAEILNQFGGKSFFYMVGGKDLCINDDNCLQFKIGRNSASVNTVFVGLRADDTYYLKFSRVWWSNKDFERKETIKKEFEGVYCDQLAELFRETTGLETRMPRIVGFNAKIKSPGISRLCKGEIMKWELIKAIEEQGYKLAGLSENGMGIINIAIESNNVPEKDSNIEVEESEKAMTFQGVKWASKNLEADKYVKVGDRFYIEKLTVKETGSFEKINLENVPVIAVDVRKDSVLFNFENILFRHCIDDDYEEGGNFEETELGVYLKDAFKNALEKAICVGVYDCSLLTKEQVFEDLEYFKSRKNRIKVLSDDSDTWWWWTKSPDASNSTGFCAVTNGGDSGNINASGCIGGVAPAFLITRD